MIQAKNITKAYNGLTVLKDVSLNIQKGDFISIVGASGAGKTTLLQILGLLDRASSGSIKYDGEETLLLSDKKQARFRNLNVGFVFQFHHLLPEFTALENVMIPAMIANRDMGEAKNQAANWLKKLGMQDRMEHKPNELSGGEQQRVAIARAFINNPKVIFMDEPTGNLDSKNAEEIHKLIVELRQQTGQTFVVVTHNKELAALADRTLSMKDGLIEG